MLRRQLDDPDLTPGVRDRVHEAIDALAAAGFELVDVDVPELELVDDALGAIVLREAWDVHRERFEREADGYGAGHARAARARRARLRRRLPRGARRPGAGRRCASRACSRRSRCWPARPSRIRHRPRTRRSARRRAMSRDGSPARTTSPACPADLAALRPRRRDRCPPGCSSPPPPANDALLLSVAEAYEEDRAVRIEDCNWMQVEEYLEHDDRS